MSNDPFKTLSSLKISTGEYAYYSLAKLTQAGQGTLEQLPFSIRIMLEGILRRCDEKRITREDVLALAHWSPQSDVRAPLPFFPGRVVMQDFSGIPVVNDLAAMRSALVKLGGKAEQINPIVPVDLVIDHSIQVDAYGTPQAFAQNNALEFERNRERYEFLHWAQKAFTNFRVVPPSSGIVHQVNLEYLTSLVLTQEEDGKRLVFPETLVGTDSHTTMINGLGVVGWGVGGIEAVAVMLGEPIEILTPDVIGFKLTGKVPEGVTSTDVTLTVIQMLRKQGVVDKFVEFYGPGLDNLTLADRAMIANMTPECGATMIYFPVDDQSLEYLILTGRVEVVELVKAYYQAQQLFRSAATPDPSYSLHLELDLSSIEPSLAGPKRPQDRVSLNKVQSNFQQSLILPRNERGYALTETDLQRSAETSYDHKKATLKHGSVVIAAITSCTNTSNPYVMVGAGLLARKAVEKGLKVQPYVKTSLAPGSRVVTDYLEKAGLLAPLAQLGFNVVAYGCTTCIGNAGPLPEPTVDAINSQNLVVAAVLSGNRNFEGRVSPHTQANYLASPPLVVAYALSGTVDIDLTHEPIGNGRDGQPVFLRDIWPSTQEIQETVLKHVKPQLFVNNYANLFTGNETWNKLETSGSLLYPWESSSTYLQEPPFFDGLTHQPAPISDVREARVLALLGDSITTDHISPAGSIPAKSAAGQYLISQGVQPVDFNSYGSRRGNDRVLTRGTLANIRIKNLLLPGIEGSFTLHLPDQKQMSIYDAAMQYKAEGTPLIIIAGKEYGTGSSRDWAAKGVRELGVRAILAESYERIHRSNLAGMGVLPLQFQKGENAASLGLNGQEVFYLEGLDQLRSPGGTLIVRAIRTDGTEINFKMLLRLDTANEVAYFHNGGIMNLILRNSVSN